MFRFDNEDELEEVRRAYRCATVCADRLQRLVVHIEQNHLPVDEDQLVRAATIVLALSMELDDLQAKCIESISRRTVAHRSTSDAANRARIAQGLA